MRANRIVAVGIAVLLAALVPLPTGCSQPARNLPAAPVERPWEDATQAVDPIVVRALEGYETTGAPFTSGEIVGYLVDYVVRKGTSTSIVEYVVLTDGSTRRYGPPDTRMRPRGAFGRAPSERLGPEPPEAAAIRENAIAIAQAAVVRDYPRMAAAKPMVFGYLVRLNRIGGAVTVWVESGGRGEPGLARPGLQADQL